MHDAEGPWFRNPDALVLAAPMGVSLIAVAAGHVVRLASGDRLDPFLRDVVVFSYGTLGPPLVGILALAVATRGELATLRAALAGLLMVPGYWAIVLTVCALLALDFPEIGALGLLVSYAAFCSFTAWLQLRARPRLQQGLAAALLLVAGASGAIPEPPSPVRAAAPRVSLGRTGPPPQPVQAVEVPETDADPLPPVGGSQPALPAPVPAPELALPDREPESPDRSVSPLEDRIQRQLARNGLSRVDIRVEPEAVIATGLLRSPDERLRLRLVVESLAPHLRYRDLTRVEDDG